MFETASFVAPYQHILPPIASFSPFRSVVVRATNNLLPSSLSFYLNNLIFYFSFTVFVVSYILLDKCRLSMLYILSLSLWNICFVMFFPSLSLSLIHSCSFSDHWLML